MTRLSGKVAIVTGAAMCIGRACAERMAQEGARVAVVDTQAELGEAVAAGIRRRGGQARYFTCNVTSEDAVDTLMQRVADVFGRIDILINNAGISGVDKPTHEVTEAEWDHLQAVNVKGAFFCTKHAIPHLRRAGGGGIVNLSSIYGLVGAPDLPPYHASKGALRLMSKTVGADRKVIQNGAGAEIQLSRDGAIQILVAVGDCVAIAGSLGRRHAGSIPDRPQQPTKKSPRGAAWR